MLHTTTAVVVAVTTGLEYVVETYDVALDVSIGVGYRVAHTGLGGEVYYYLKVVLGKETVYEGAVGEVAFDKSVSALGVLCSKLFEALQAVVLDGRVVVVVYTVEIDYLYAGLGGEQTFYEVGANKSGGSGYEYLHMANVLLLSVLLAGLVIGVERAYVKSACCHGPSVHGGVVYHIVCEVAGGIFATTISYRVAQKWQVGLEVYVERGYGPMSAGLLGLLLHIEHTMVIVELYHTGALQLLNRGLVVAHDTAGALLLGKLHKFVETEEEQIVGGNDKYIVVDMELLNGQQKVAYGTETRLIGRCSVVDDGNGLGIVLLCCPLLKYMCKLVVGDDDVLGDVGYGVDVVEHTSQYGVVAYAE